MIDMIDYFYLMKQKLHFTDFKLGVLLLGIAAFIISCSQNEDFNDTKFEPIEVNPFGTINPSNMAKKHMDWKRFK
jgi:hypothetical protein